MEESLLGASAGVGAEDDFPGEGFGTSQRVDREKERVVFTIKLDGGAVRGIDQLRVSQDYNGVPADRFERVDVPDDRGRFRSFFSS